MAARVSYLDGNAGRRGRGMAVALAVHVALVCLMVSGTARQSLAQLAKPLQVVVIQEVAIAPLTPPPPPPPPTKSVQMPRAQPTPAPPYVPPPELPLAAPPALAIEAVAQPPHEPPTAMVPAPVVAAPAPAPSPRQDMAVVCPTQVPPEMPRRAQIDGIQGVVKAQVRIVDGIVREVSFLGGPRVFYPAVRAAMLQYKCSRESGEIVATQDFNFRLQP